MKFNHFPLALLPGVLAVLSACGGGGDGGTGATTTDASAAATTTSTSPIATAIPQDASPAVTTKTLAQTVTPAASTKIPVSPATSPAPTPTPTPATSATVSDSVRLSAATATAQSATNVCGSIKPFYWEIGNKDARTASGSVMSSASTTKVTSATVMSVASASKWIYGAYVAQRLNGALSAQDVKFMTMRSGYTNLSQCLQNQTVDTCLAYDGNGNYIASTDGAFDYDGGHMEKHASLLGMGGLNAKTLTTTVLGQIGSDVKIAYSSPQLAGGVYASADAYALFLRKILGGSLRIGSMLGSSAVCTNKYTCPAGTAISAPIPPNESWHYSIGHWVEDDPVVGDGAFSSPGAFGFYPWIDASRTYYGVVARMTGDGAITSMQCGRLIRKAWMTGTAF